MNYALAGLAGFLVGLLPIVAYLIKVLKERERDIKAAGNDERKRNAQVVEEADRLREVNLGLDRQLDELRQKLDTTARALIEAQQQAVDLVKKHASDISSLETRHREALSKALVDARAEAADLVLKHATDIQVFRSEQAAELKRMAQVHETDAKRAFEEGRQRALAGYRFEVTPFWRKQEIGMPGFRRLRVQIGVRLQNYYEGFEITPAMEHINQEIVEKKVDTEEIMRLAAAAVKAYVALKTGGMALFVHDLVELPRLAV